MIDNEMRDAVVPAFVNTCTPFTATRSGKQIDCRALGQGFLVGGMLLAQAATVLSPVAMSSLQRLVVGLVKLAAAAV